MTLKYVNIDNVYLDNDGLKEHMQGCVFTHVYKNDDLLAFVRDDGVVIVFVHQQDCCESVYIESVVGDVQDLVGEPLLLVDCVSDEDAPQPSGGHDKSHTWTFYKFATRKGYVDVRWFGSSNGYYSEDVDCIVYPSLDAVPDEYKGGL